MNRLTDNKIVLVTRPTRLAELVVRFNTVSQARFYIEHQGADFLDYQREDETYHHALVEAQTVLAELGRVQTVDRAFLPNFVFAPDDTVVTLGQDGLVANTLKYLDGQPVVGVNPDPARWDGKLLPFKVCDLTKVIPEVLAHGRHTKTVTMAKATLNNGQTMYAVNDLFIGPPHAQFGAVRDSVRQGKRDPLFERRHRLDRNGLDRLVQEPDDRRSRNQPIRRVGAGSTGNRKHDGYPQADERAATKAPNERPN